MKTIIDNRPWGNFERFTHNEKTTVKIITINPKKRFSLQYHNKRQEFWKILQGNVKIIIGRKALIAKEGDCFFIKKKVLHRAQALDKPVRILEIAFGNFDENDIIRLEDDYGRIKK